MAANGTAIINFGSWPGANEASVVVTGQTGIASDSKSDAWLVGIPTSDHTANDHAYAAALCGVSTADVVAGTGFTITARSAERMQGTFTVQWAWV